MERILIKHANTPALEATIKRKINAEQRNNTKKSKPNDPFEKRSGVENSIIFIEHQ